MIKYTKEAKLYKSNLKKILLRLLKYKIFFYKYKSHIVLALLVGIASFVLGHTIAYNNNLTWVYANKDRTERFVQISAESYELQSRITYNYADAIKILIDCSDFSSSTCDYSASAQKLQQLSEEKDRIFLELNNLNIKTGNLLKEMGIGR